MPDTLAPPSPPAAAPTGTPAPPSQAPKSDTPKAQVSPPTSKPARNAAFDDLDAVDKGQPLPSGAKPPGVEPEPDNAPRGTTPPASVEIDAPNPPTATATEPPPTGPGSIRELRTAYETAKAERAALRA